MTFPDLNLLKQQAEQFKNELEHIKIQGQSGAGMVKITINARHECDAVEIDDSCLQESKDVLETLVMAAINDATQKIAQTVHQHLLQMKQNP